MAQLSQNAVQQATSSLSNILTSFRTDARSSNMGQGLFSSLLNETSASLPQVEAYDPSKAQASRPTKGDDVQKDEPAPSRSRDQGDVELRQEARRDDESARARVREESAPVTKSKSSEQIEQKKCEKEEASNEEAATETDVSDASMDTQATDPETVVLDAKSGKKEEKDALDQLIEDDIAALMLALLPFEDKAQKAATSGESKIVEAVDETVMEGQTETDSSSLMMAMSKLEGLGEKIAKKVEDTLEKRLGSAGKKMTGEALAAPVQEENPAATETVTLDAKQMEDALVETADTESAYSKMVDDGSLSQQHKAGGAKQESSQDFFNMMRGRSHEANAHVNASATGVANASLQSTATTANGEAASQSASSVSGTSSQNTTTLAAGARPVGSYDFASELSAARVTKGGTAGLPQAVEQVTVQLHKAAKSGVNEMTIQLRPAELGKIEIKLEFGPDKSVTAVVTADNQATLTMLQKDSSSLQRALQEAGLQADAGCMQFNLSEDNQARHFGQSEADSQSMKNRFAFDEAQGGEDGLIATASSETETYYVTPGRVNLRV
jgi:hypothetical protein